MVILDTDFIIKILRGKPAEAISLYKYIIKHRILLKTTVISYAELYEGVFLAENVPKALEHLDQFFSMVEILPFTIQDAQKFGQIQANLSKKGTPIGDFDAAIVAITISKEEVLITRNEKHFQYVTTLKYRNWDDNSWDRNELLIEK